MLPDFGPRIACFGWMCKLAPRIHSGRAFQSTWAHVVTAHDEGAWCSPSPGPLQLQGPGGWLAQGRPWPGSGHLMQPTGCRSPCTTRCRSMSKGQAASKQQEWHQPPTRAWCSKHLSAACIKTTITFLCHSSVIQSPTSMTTCSTTQHMAYKPIVATHWEGWRVSLCICIRRSLHVHTNEVATAERAAQAVW